MSADLPVMPGFVSFDPPGARPTVTGLSEYLAALPPEVLDQVLPLRRGPSYAEAIAKRVSADDAGKQLFLAEPPRKR